MKKSLLLTLCIVLTCTVSAQKYLGGDVSLLLTYEENGANYMDIDGKKITDLLAFLKEQGLNTMRVRLFVDPSKASAEAKGQGVRQDLEYVKKLGKKIKDAGLGFMLDFHYSDIWADPEHQTMPQEFIMVNTPAFEYIYTYTKNSLEAMVTAGATPDFIQIGNEISFGMLWDGCKVKHNSDWTAYLDDNWDSFSKALKNASKACREVCPEAKIIIHTEQCANNPTLDVAFFNRIKANEVNYDIIGTSYYPYYKGPISNLDKGLTQLEINFPDKQIMIVETGCGYHYKMGDKETGYPLTNEGQRQYTEDLVTMLNKHQNVNGLFWWFLEANEYGLDWATKRVTDSWYNASLFDNETGRALPALYELKNFRNGEMLRGDVNGNGSVDAEDITDTVDYMTGLSAKGIQKETIDVNNDGIVNVADIVVISNIILGSKS
ncbi:MAG: glycosyl hydrolase 53 family protein [Prevotella sp.]|nr:glycosyl hydrolase 53 family protein [Prevotella sp.]